MDHVELDTRQHARYLNTFADKIESGSKERTYWLEDDPNKMIVTQSERASELIIKNMNRVELLTEMKTESKTLWYKFARRFLK